MGHLGHFKEDYAALVERLKAGQVSMPEPRTPEARAGWQEVLEILYTPEDAALAARMPVRPAGLGAIAARVGMTPEELAPRLEAMADRGLVMDIIHPKTGKVRYFLSPPVVGFFEFTLMRRRDDIPQKRMALALDAYLHGDPTFAEEAFGHETVVGRALVQENVIADDLVPDVLDWERATELIAEADPIGVSLCYCRHEAEHAGRACDAPMEACLTINQGADYVIRRQGARQLDKREALDILARARDHGLVQIADNVQSKPVYICNCCGCCCGQLSAINDYELAAVKPSGFLPAHDAERCSGCSRCARACPITAITMLPVRRHAERKNTMAPDVDGARCIGCGVCANACKKKAMHMVRRPEQPYVPANGMERIVRMSLERGRLADLLFDAGQSRSHRYLNSVVQVITHLPVAERILASEQVHSRFVRFALGTKPTR